MGRLIIWIVLLTVVGWFWRRSQRTPAQQPLRRGGTPPNRPQLPEPMVQCAECGAHAPASESIGLAGKSFCSREHAQRYVAAARR